MLAVQRKGSGLTGLSFVMRMATRFKECVIDAINVGQVKMSPDQLTIRSRLSPDSQIRRNRWSMVKPERAIGTDRCQRSIGRTTLRYSEINR